MSTAIERVILLKSVDLFAKTPDDLLLEVAERLTSLDLRPGETLFSVGDVGDSLYIIVSGTIHIHNGEQTLNFLGARDIFGEMALIDSGPRMASATALDAVELLKLDQESFFELMDDRIEIARGVIRVLTGHLRNRVGDLHAAQLIRSE